jgi:predicted NBD/HSP70 family sugar kinase
MRRVNRGGVLKCILTREENTRVGIAEALCLTKTTLTNIVADMIEGGILMETSGGRQANRLGRKSVSLELSPRAPAICGLLVKRRRICAIIGAMDGRILERITYALDSDLTMETFRNKLGEIFLRIMERASQPVFAVSVAAIGPIDCDAGIILRPTDFYRETADFPLREFLESLTDLPIFFTHDSSAAAYAEHLYDNAAGQDTFLFLSLEAGISGGLCLDGRIYNGMFGRSGEIGHTSIRYDGEVCKCGNRGCLELYAGMNAMLRSAEAYRRFLPEHPIFREPMDIHQVILSADAGDALCQELLGEYCAYLAHALCNVITLLNIRTIYVGTPVEAANHVFESLLSERLNERIGPLAETQAQVFPSALGVEAALYGTIAAVMEQVFEGMFFPFEQVVDPAPNGARSNIQA